LALAYAQAHPGQVRALMIGAIFTATPRELAWFYHPDGLARFFPQEYAELCALLDTPAWEDMPQRIQEAVRTDSPQALKVGRAVCLLDALSMELVPNREEIDMWLDSEEFTLEPVRIWAHYFSAGCFLEPNYLLAQAHLLPQVPVHILHAGLDLCCPVESAVRLHQAVPGSTLEIIPLCGHRATMEMDMARVAATDAMAKRLGY